MAAVTQKIERFTGGISDQPDEIKLPGQLRDAVNCIPDVVQGLIKRPGMNLVRELITDSKQYGKWFFIDKSNNFNTGDRYVGQIDNRATIPNPDFDPDEEVSEDNPEEIRNPNGGKVKVWSLDTGKLMDICYTDVVDPLEIDARALGGTRIVEKYAKDYTCVGETDDDGNLIDVDAQFKEYFKAPRIDDLQVLTVNDYTFVTNRTIPVQMGKVSADIRDPEATVELRSIAGLQDYVLEFKQPIPNEDEIPNTSVTNISVQVVGLPQDAPGCSGKTNTVIENRDVDQDDGKGTGLRFRIRTTAVSVPIDGQSDSRQQFRCVYATEIDLLDKGVGYAAGQTITLNLGTATYIVKIETVGKDIPSGDIGTATYTTPRENPKADAILDDLKADIEGFGAGFVVERIGNTLYIKRPPQGDTPRPFSVTSNNSILLRALSSTAVDDAETSFLVQANSIDEVPLQTKHNLPFFIRNSFTDSDDYYVQFKGNNDNDGPGTYVEIAKPGLPHQFMPASMPHGLLRLSDTREDDDGDIIVTFLVTSFEWAMREAGDDLTNPRPSFAPKTGSVIGRAINNISFFRNRLIFLNDENVVASTAGDFFNFWSKTALTVSPSDPIDLQVSNNFPAELFAAQATSAGLVLFSENAQFLFGTENDILSPQTARTNLLCTYNFNRNSNAINLGTTVGFVSGIGRYTRFYEMANISRDAEPEVIEQSKVVERLLPGGYNEIGMSKDNQAAMFGTRGLDEVWMFRYFNTGERRAQSSWVRWKLIGELVSHACINDSYFNVVFKDGRVFLCRGDYRALATTIMLDDANGEEYRTFLDYGVNALPDEYTVHSKKGRKDGKDFTTITHITIDPDDIGFPVFDDMKDKVMSVVYDPKTDEGFIAPVTVGDDNTLTIETSVPEQSIFVGYVYEMLAAMPQFYVKQEQGGQVKSWDTGNVIISRVKLNLGRIGFYTTKLDRLGRPMYVQKYEAKPMDKYDANELGYLADYEQTTPVYQRNTTFYMSVSSEHPSPAVLYSATWEGQYQENYVKRL